MKLAVAVAEAQGHFDLLVQELGVVDEHSRIGRFIKAIRPQLRGVKLMAEQLREAVE